MMSFDKRQLIYPNRFACGALIWFWLKIKKSKGQTTLCRLPLCFYPVIAL
jgi:hypothetical protein